LTLPASDAPPPAPRSGIIGMAHDTIDALKTSPAILLIVLLNMAFAGGAAYYLVTVENYRAAGTTRLLDLLEKCALHTIPLEALPAYREHKSKD
jgi:hypothetical protein